MRSAPLALVAALLLACGPSGGSGALPDASMPLPAIDAAMLPADATMLHPMDLAVAPSDFAMGPRDLFGCVDMDNDTFTTCDGDCNDNDPSIHPGAKEICNGKDNDCNGTVDDLEDHDGDGYTVCTDCNDSDPLINPGAMDVPNSNVDYDCDGKIDPPGPCDVNLASDSANPGDYASAIEICPSQFLVKAEFPTLADPRAKQVAPDWGLFATRKGVAMAAFSTGIAADENDVKPMFDKNNTVQPGTDFGMANIPNPVPMGQNCGGVDINLVNDYTELKLTLKAPTNAKSFSFDFNYLSAEYPEYVCTQYNDKFLALMDSKNTKGNISFDAKGNPVTVNNGFFSLTQPNQLTGTGMEKIDFSGKPTGGATGWLTTTAPVTPGETFTLRFIVFDEGDGIYDSQVLIDHFSWSLMIANTGTTRAVDGGN
jgi:hypothetical protein